MQTRRREIRRRGVIATAVLALIFLLGLVAAPGADAWTLIVLHAFTGAPTDGQRSFCCRSDQGWRGKIFMARPAAAVVPIGNGVQAGSLVSMTATNSRPIAEGSPTADRIPPLLAGRPGMSSVFQAGILRIESLFYERWYGISTRGRYGWHPGDWITDERIYYSTIPYRAIFRVLNYVSPKQEDVIADLGCGKGDVARVIGIEDTAELSARARANLRRMRHRRAHASVLDMKAEEYDYSEVTVVYLYHPFGAETMKAVLSRIQAALIANSQPLKIAYVNPVHDSVLAEAGWLERFASWPDLAGTAYGVSFWQSRPFAV
jgi:hypothetical protein